MTLPPSDPTQASPAPKHTRTLTPALLSALAALVVLAVVTVIVVVTGGDDDPPAASGTTSSSAAPSSSEEAPSSGAPPTTDPPTIVDSDLGVQYTYPMNGYDSFDWAGPGDVTAGIVEINSTVSYAACQYDAGSDLLFGLVTSEETDLAQAAKIAAVDLAKSVWSNSGEASITEPSAPEEKMTDEGVTGQLVEIDSTRANSEPDVCGTTNSHIGAFAFENSSGDVVVMISSHRTDGETLKDANGFADDVAATFQSLALV